MLQSPVMDTLAISGKLRAAGFTEPQAAAQVEALQEATEEATEDLVTKNDLQLAIAELKAHSAEMEARLMRQIVFAIAGSMTAQTAIFAVIVKLL